MRLVFVEIILFYFYTSMVFLLKVVLLSSCTSANALIPVFLAVLQLESPLAPWLHSCKCYWHYQNDVLSSEFWFWEAKKVTWPEIRWIKRLGNHRNSFFIKYWLMNMGVWLGDLEEDCHGRVANCPIKRKAPIFWAFKDFLIKKSVDSLSWKHNSL